MTSSGRPSEVRRFGTGHLSGVSGRLHRCDPERILVVFLKRQTSLSFRLPVSTVNAVKLLPLKRTRRHRCPTRCSRRGSRRWPSLGLRQTLRLAPEVDAIAGFPVGSESRRAHQWQREGEQNRRREASDCDHRREAPLARVRARRLSHVGAQGFTLLWIVGQDCILRAGLQPALVGLFTSDPGGLPTRAGYQPAPQFLPDSRFWEKYVALGALACQPAFYTF